MTRTKQELEKSKKRLAAALEAIKEELAHVDDELRALERGAPLNEMFFWDNIVRMLARTEGGLTSAQILRRLQASGHEVNAVNLRTFLSRNKSRGNLLTFDGSSPVKWQITPKIANIAQGLGVAIAQQPSGWRR